MRTSRFEGKTALIVGGANGMGKACTEQLTRERARVHILDKDTDSAATLANTLTQAGHEATFATVDVMDEESFTSAFETMLSDFDGQLDVMIHIAGASRGGLLRDQTVADWDWHYRVNLRSHVISCKLATDVMTTRGTGAIVTMSSISGLRGDPGWAGYNASKAAIRNFTESIAWEVGRHGVRVNCVAPGPVMSERMMNSILGEDDMVGSYHRKTALARLVRPEEVMEAILFLASDAASAVTGHTLVVDCGLTARTGQPLKEHIFVENAL